MPEVATPNQGEREFETGTDEFFKKPTPTAAPLTTRTSVTYANIKRTYDAYQDLDSGRPPFAVAVRPASRSRSRRCRTASRRPTWSASRPSGTPMSRPTPCGPTN